MPLDGQPISVAENVFLEPGYKLPSLQYYSNTDSPIYYAFKPKKELYPHQ